MGLASFFPGVQWYPGFSASKLQLAAADDILLHIGSQGREQGAVAGDADHQILVLFRVLLGLAVDRIAHNIELNLLAVFVEEYADQIADPLLLLPAVQRGLSRRILKIAPF